MVLTTMKITKALDEKGVPIEAEVKYESLIVKLVYSWFIQDVHFDCPSCF